MMIQDIMTVTTEELMVLLCENNDPYAVGFNLGVVDEYGNVKAEYPKLIYSLKGEEKTFDGRGSIPRLNEQKATLERDGIPSRIEYYPRVMSMLLIAEEELAKRGIIHNEELPTAKQRAGIVRIIKAALSLAPYEKVYEASKKMIDQYAIAPQEVGVDKTDWK